MARQKKFKVQPYTEENLMLNNEDATFIPFRLEFSNFPGIVSGNSNVFSSIENRIISVELPQKNVNLEDTYFNGQVQIHAVDQQDEAEQTITLTILCDRLFTNFLAWENWRKTLKRGITLGPRFLKDNKIHSIKIWFLDAQMRETFAFVYTDCVIETLSSINLTRNEVDRPTFQAQLRFVNDEIVVGDQKFLTTNGFDIVDPTLER